MKTLDETHHSRMMRRTIIDAIEFLRDSLKVSSPQQLLESEHEWAANLLETLERGGIDTSNWDGDGTPIEIIGSQIVASFNDFNVRLNSASECAKSLKIKEQAMFELKYRLEELIGIIDNRNANFDSFTTQPARAILKKYFKETNSRP